MSDLVSVTLPEGVWDDLCTYEAYRPALSPSVRKALTDGAQTWTPRTGWMRQAPGRILTLTLEQAEDLEAWLTNVVARPRAPAASVAALVTLREARYRVLAAAGWICADCLSVRTGTTANGVYESLQRIAETAALTTDVARCGRCLREKVVHRLD